MSTNQKANEMTFKIKQLIEEFEMENNLTVMEVRLARGGVSDKRCLYGVSVYLSPTEVKASCLSPSSPTSPDKTS